MKILKFCIMFEQEIPLIATILFTRPLIKFNWCYDEPNGTYLLNLNVKLYIKERTSWLDHLDGLARAQPQCIITLTSTKSDDKCSS